MLSIPIIDDANDVIREHVLLGHFCLDVKTQSRGLWITQQNLSCVLVFVEWPDNTSPIFRICLMVQPLKVIVLVSESSGTVAVIWIPKFPLTSNEVMERGQLRLPIYGVAGIIPSIWVYSGIIDVERIQSLPDSELVVNITDWRVSINLAS